MDGARGKRDRGPLKAFGAAVRAARTDRGWSQDTLAQECGLDRTYLSGIERGVRNPTLKVVWTIARALETQGSELLKAAEDAWSTTIVLGLRRG